MSDNKQHRFTAVIADADPIVFRIDASEEAIYRKAVKLVNEQWSKLQAEHPGRVSHNDLAKVALGVAELYYRKKEQFEKQSKLLENFEKELDGILLKMD